MNSVSQAIFSHDETTTEAGPEHPLNDLARAFEIEWNASAADEREASAPWPIGHSMAHVLLVSLGFWAVLGTVVCVAVWAA